MKTPIKFLNPSVHHLLGYPLKMRFEGLTENFFSDSLMNFLCYGTRSPLYTNPHFPEPFVASIRESNEEVT